LSRYDIKKLEVEIYHTGMSILESVSSKDDLKRWKTTINTRYKRKDKKVRRSMLHYRMGLVLKEGLCLRWYVGWIWRKDSSMWNRLTPERLAQMQIGGDFLTCEEKQLFVDILFDYEGAIAFDKSEMGLLHPSIEPQWRFRRFLTFLGNNRTYAFQSRCRKRRLNMLNRS
jgi:hypothetical protein